MVLFRNPVPTMSGLYFPFPNIVLVYADIFIAPIFYQNRQKYPTL
jgi:hypothetical protein